MVKLISGGDEYGARLYLFYVTFFCVSNLSSREKIVCTREHVSQVHTHLFIVWFTPDKLEIFNLIIFLFIFEKAKK